jgi:hypothetical protein
MRNKSKRLLTTACETRSECRLPRIFFSVLRARLVAFCFALGCVAAIFAVGGHLAAQTAQALKLEGDVEYFRPLRG